MARQGLAKSEVQVQAAWAKSLYGGRRKVLRKPGSRRNSFWGESLVESFKGYRHPSTFRGHTRGTSSQGLPGRSLWNMVTPLAHLLLISVFQNMWRNGSTVAKSRSKTNMRENRAEMTQSSRETFGLQKSLGLIKLKLLVIQKRWPHMLWHGGRFFLFCFFSFPLLDTNTLCDCLRGF